MPTSSVMLLSLKKVTNTLKGTRERGGCDTPSLRPLKNNRRVLRRAKAPLVHSLFSLPPSPSLCHWQRSTPSPQRYTSVVCSICYNLRKLQRIFASFVKIFQPAKALEIFLLSASYAIFIRGNPEPHFVTAASHRHEINARCAGRS